jgi:hypothetical protein
VIPDHNAGFSDCPEVRCGAIQHFDTALTPLEHRLMVGPDPEAAGGVRRRQAVDGPGSRSRDQSVQVTL